ncbi:hypothetical protein Ait01nite_052970 [Actinoplanes italicus]|nr:hypothetical protein Ait01nite_052970 [Actinoplanes italicus]
MTVAEVQARFVDAPMFEDSVTRQTCWEGFQNYMALWAKYKDSLGDVIGESSLVRCLWLAGSFISSKPDPNNIDLTLFVDGDVLDAAKQDGLPVTTPVARLSNRDKNFKLHRVTPIIVRYRYFKSPFKHGFYSSEAEYMRFRGGLDDFFSRVRQPGEDKQAPTRETGDWKRGYVEVML